MGVRAAGSVVHWLLVLLVAGVVWGAEVGEGTGELSSGALVATGALDGDDDDSDDDDDALRVMSRNMYIGAPLAPILSAPPQQIPALAAQTLQVIFDTNFPERAGAMADEISRTRPHLIGLQEVWLILTQSPSDSVLGGTVPAQDVLFDFLATLMAELEARDLDYRVAAVLDNSDTELPKLNPDLTFDDVRVIDRDVVLVRDSVRIGNVTTKNFAVFLQVPGLDVERGWIALDATLGDDGDSETVRFINTHLEPFSPAIRQAQISEVLASEVAETRPTILLGDLNSVAPAAAAYNLVLDAGFEDAWATVRGASDPGFTCCHLSDLSNSISFLGDRIDFVFVRNFVERQPVNAFLVGDDPADRTASGLWPSDHAGVIADLAEADDDD